MAETLVMLILKSFYLMLPAYFANMAPVVAKKIRLFEQPVDFGVKIGKKPLFGKNKTFRGFFFGILFAIVISYLQYLPFNLDFFGNISVVNYKKWLLLGFLLGFGALAGDLIKSFFKRRIGIEPGHKFIPFDQTDFVIGALICVAPAFDITLQIFLASIILSFILHIIVNHLAFWLKIRSEAW